MKRNWHRALIGGLACVLATSGCLEKRMGMGTDRAETRVGTSQDAAVVEALRRLAHPIGREEEDRALAPIIEAIGEAGLVGLGEASHGTREFFELRRRLFQLLVERKGARVLALEAHLSYVSSLDRFVKTGEWKQPQGHHDGIFASREFFELLTWMRQYNQNVPASRSLSVAAIDVQYPYAEAERIAAHLALVDPLDAELAKAAYAPLLPPFEYATAEASRQRACREGIERIITLLDANRDALIAKSSTAAHAQIRHFAVTMRATEAMWRCREDQMFEMFNLRDRAMADHVAYLRNQAYPGQKVVLLAHDGHVARGAHRAHGLRNLGEHLAQRYGRDYFPLGFSFYSGHIRASAPGGDAFEPTPVPPARPDSVDAQFHRTGLPSFWLDLRDTDREPALSRWLAVDRPHRSIGAVYQEADDTHYYDERVLPRAFDGLIFIAESHPSRYD